MNKDEKHAFVLFLGFVQDLGQCHRTLIELYDGDDEIIDAMNAVAPAFFNQILAIYRDHWALLIARLTDNESWRGKDYNLSIQRFLNLADSNGYDTREARAC